MGVNDPAQVPLAEPPWLRGLPTPYYNESHRRFQRSCRGFLDENLHAHALEWESQGDVPAHLFATFAKNNFILPALPAPLPVEWLRRLGVMEMPGQVPIEEWDSLHCMIYSDEVRAHQLNTAES